MRITQVTYVMQIADGPDFLTPDQVAGAVAHMIATSIGPVAGIRFDEEARDLTPEEWLSIQDVAIAEDRAVFV
jgi:hypothetical protein